MALQFKKKISWKNIIYIVLILLFLIPQTRTPIQVAFQKLKMKVFSPSAVAADSREKIPPFDYKVVSPDGIQRTAPIGKGNVTFLSYWATWCPPCIAEIPSIEELYADYGNKVDFILISQEDPKVVQRFLEKKAINLPAVSPAMETPEALFERSIPTNYIIDQFGNIVVKETGAQNWNNESIRTTLDKLLGA